MKALRAGQRVGSTISVMIVVAITCLLVASLALTLDFRANEKRDRHQLRITAQVFHDYQRAVYRRCIIRAAYDARTDYWKQQIQNYYADLQANIELNAAVASPFYQRLLHRIHAIMFAGNKALNHPQLAGCGGEKPEPLPR